MNDVKNRSRFIDLKSLIIGTALIAVGGLLLTDQAYLLDDLDWRYVFPGVIGLFGIIDIIQPAKPEQIAKGFFNLVLAFWLFASLSHLWGWTFYNSWPAILIAFGIRSVVAGLLSSKK